MFGQMMFASHKSDNYEKAVGNISLSVGKTLALVGFFLAIKEVLLQCITNKSVLYRAKV